MHVGYGESTKFKAPLDECQELHLGVAMMVQGLNFDITEEMFLRRFARFKDGRYDFGHVGIVGIKFNYEGEPGKHIRRSQGSIAR